MDSLDRSYNSLIKITKLLSIALYIGIGFSLISITLSLISNGSTIDLNLNPESENYLRKPDQNVEEGVFKVYGGLYSLIYLLIALIFLYWFFRSYKNLYSFTEVQLKFSPLKAVAYCIIPIINLWKPYFIMKEILFTSKVPSDQSNLALSFDDSTLVKGWWILFLSSIFFPLIGTSFFSEYISNLVTNILLILTSILLLYLTKEITSRQERRFKNISTNS